MYKLRRRFYKLRRRFYKLRRSFKITPTLHTFNIRAKATFERRKGPQGRGPHRSQRRRPPSASEEKAPPSAPEGATIVLRKGKDYRAEGGPRPRGPNLWNILQGLRNIHIYYFFARIVWPLRHLLVSLQRTSRRRRVPRRNPADWCDVRHVASYCKAVE